MSGLLDDLRVIDLSGEGGLFAGRFLAQLGADVIWVEPPDGSPVRARRPFLDETEGLERSLYHLHFNSGKRGVTLDIRLPDGAALLRRLAEGADVLIETEAPGEMEALGLGYRALSALNPSLLYGTVTPFGQEGPLAGYRASDMIAVAMSGLMFLNGDPEDPPNVPTAEQAYHMGSLALVSGILIALAGRDRRARVGEDRGQRIDVSMQEAASMATLQNAHPVAYTWHGDIPGRRGFTGPSGGRAMYQCRDRLWVTFTVPPARWNDFIEWLDEEGIESELRDVSREERGFAQRNAAMMSKAVQELVDRYDRDQLFHEGQGRRLLVMPVNDARDLVQDPQLTERGYFSSVEHTAVGRSLTDTGAPMLFGGERPAASRPAPMLGEHNEEVYCELLGLSGSEVASLRERGVV